MNAALVERVPGDRPAGAAGKAPRQPCPESPVRKAEDGKLIVKCPRCKLNTKFTREEIPKD